MGRPTRGFPGPHSPQLRKAHNGLRTHPLPDGPRSAAAAPNPDGLRSASLQANSWAHRKKPRRKEAHLNQGLYCSSLFSHLQRECTSFISSIKITLFFFFNLLEPVKVFQFLMLRQFGFEKNENWLAMYHQIHFNQDSTEVL